MTCGWMRADRGDRRAICVLFGCRPGASDHAVPR